MGNKRGLKQLYHVISEYKKTVFDSLQKIFYKCNIFETRSDTRS